MHSSHFPYFSSSNSPVNFQEIYQETEELFQDFAKNSSGNSDTITKISRRVLEVLNHEEICLSNPLNLPPHDLHDFFPILSLQGRVIELKRIQKVLLPNTSPQTKNRVKEEVENFLRILRKIPKDLDLLQTTTLEERLHKRIERALLINKWIATEETKINSLFEREYIYSKNGTTIKGKCVSFDTPKKFCGYNSTMFIRGVGENAEETIEGLFFIDTPQLVKGSIKQNNGTSLNGLYDLQTKRLLSGKIIFKNGIQLHTNTRKGSDFQTRTEYSKEGMIIRSALYYAPYIPNGSNDLLTDKLLSERSAPDTSMQFVYHSDGDVEESRRYDPLTESLLETKVGVFDSKKRLLNGTHTLYLDPNNPYSFRSYQGMFDALTGLPTQGLGELITSCDTKESGLFKPVSGNSYPFSVFLVKGIKRSSNNIIIGEFDSKGELVTGIHFDRKLYRLIFNKKEILSQDSIQKCPPVCKELWESTQSLEFPSDDIDSWRTDPFQQRESPSTCKDKSFWNNQAVLRFHSSHRWTENTFQQKEQAFKPSLKCLESFKDAFHSLVTHKP